MVYKLHSEKSNRAIIPLTGISTGLIWIQVSNQDKNPGIVAKWLRLFSPNFAGHQVSRKGAILINNATKICLLFGLFYSAHAQSLNPTGGGGMHDPVMIKEGNTYYIYATTGAWTSTDMKRWSRAGGFVPNV